MMRRGITLFIICPDTYDYSEFYGDEINNYLQNNPEGFREELAKAWTFYKGTFILSNGLVNHSQWDPGQSQVIRTNEAVSEGQGYGMLLAVLLNDQQTFNRIYEAANQYMWDNNRKSYFIWNWPAGEQGAATDADLDIGLALVFADELVKKGLWSQYNGSVKYGTRAMDIIRSLRNNMTQNDYLLPGDNWGGDALNNLNPSYFATAWLKVFNDYQNEVDFTPVIAKCYQVLQMMPNYNKGQAADWITSSGGRASRGDRGMGNDAIRTPWRIAMDAIWYNDSRAIAYCRNTKNTLTNYQQGVINTLGQMGHYTESGSLINGTAGLVHHVAMWGSGILGSKDTEFTKATLQGRLVAQITGTAKDHFGDESLHDHQYYYNQSLAMFGFAFITGQFPNIYEDMQGDVSTGIALEERLSANATTVYFPQDVVFTATIASAAPWTLTLTGQSSGITREFSGNSADISVTWDGEGFTQVELVRAQLQVTGLQSQSDPNVLRYNVQVQGPYTSVRHLTSRAFDLHYNPGLHSMEVQTAHPLQEVIQLELFSPSGRLIGASAPLGRTHPGKWTFSLANLTRGEGLYFGRLTYRDQAGIDRTLTLDPFALLN